MKNLNDAKETLNELTYPSDETLIEWAKRQRVSRFEVNKRLVCAIHGPRDYDGECTPCRRAFNVEESA